VRGFFYDTWAFVALCNSADAHHTAAAGLDLELERRGYVGVTTDYVFDETLTALHQAAGPRVALAFADLFTARVAADDLLLAEVNGVRRGRALALFRRLSREEPRLSFTDCASFAVMHELGLELAFTADRHFHRAGKRVRPLLVAERGRLVARLPAE
jgi:predicted nucleic acid-binding protein